MQIPPRIAAEALPALILGVERLLHSHGFRSVTRSEIIDGRRCWRWERDRDWALDRVEAVYRVHRPEDPSINLLAVLRLQAGRELVLDGFTSHYLAGREDLYDFPLLQALRLRHPERLAAKIAAETESVLPWFEKYATPQACLARLQSAERNGVRIGTPPHAEAVRMLEAMR